MLVTFLVDRKMMARKETIPEIDSRIYWIHGGWTLKYTSVFEALSSTQQGWVFRFR